MGIDKIVNNWSRLFGGGNDDDKKKKKKEKEKAASKGLSRREALTTLGAVPIAVTSGSLPAATPIIGETVATGAIMAGTASLGTIIKEAVQKYETLVIPKNWKPSGHWDTGLTGWFNETVIKMFDHYDDAPLLGKKLLSGIPDDMDIGTAKAVLREIASKCHGNVQDIFNEVLKSNYFQGVSDGSPISQVKSKMNIYLKEHAQKVFSNPNTSPLVLEEAAQAVKDIDPELSDKLAKRAPEVREEWKQKERLKQDEKRTELKRSAAEESGPDYETGNRFKLQIISNLPDLSAFNLHQQQQGSSAWVTVKYVYDGYKSGLEFDPSDVPEIISYYSDWFNQKHDKSKEKISPEALKKDVDYVIYVANGNELFFACNVEGFNNFAEQKSIGNFALSLPPNVFSKLESRASKKNK